MFKYTGGKDYWGFQHIRQIRQFYNAVLKKEPLEISGEEALKTHRLIMETFNPVENSKDYVVDHLNGIRDDNTLENLRWCYQKENTQARD